MWTRLAERPAGSVSAVFSVPAERKGAYRWLESPQVPWQPLADSLHQATVRRCAEHDLIIVPVDGSSLAHTDRRAEHGVGSIGAHAQKGRGLKTMILAPLTYDGVPLGVGAHVLWARSETPHPTPHAKRQLADKESHWWTTLCEQFEQTLAQHGAHTKPWYQKDREADASHVLLRGATANSYLTVRANQDRVLNAKSNRRERLKLRAALEGSPAQGAMFMHVKSTRHRAERIARMEIRAVHVGVRLREQWSHRALGDVAVTAVQVREVSPCPDGEEPIEWLLLTTYPVHGIDDAFRVVRAYALRWVIERIHYTWKSGTCNVEDSQLESFDALRKWSTLQLSVAIDRQRQLLLSRQQPELPADEVFSREEIDAALMLYTQHRADAPEPGTTPPLGTMVDIISRLGGYIGKSSGGPPGIKVFQRGMERVADAAQLLVQLKQRRQKKHARDDSG